MRPQAGRLAWPHYNQTKNTGRHRSPARSRNWDNLHARSPEEIVPDEPELWKHCGVFLGNSRPFAALGLILIQAFEG